MDTSETYIKMCDKAGEIQAQREAIIGNFYYDPLTGVRIVGTIDSDGVNPFTIFNKQLEDSRYIWLPRQDQLQDMVGESNPLDLVARLASEVSPFGVLDDPYWHPFTSMEQLWLAFLLAEKYGKYWDGSDWVLKR